MTSVVFAVLPTLRSAASVPPAHCSETYLFGRERHRQDDQSQNLADIIKRNCTIIRARTFAVGRRHAVNPD